MKVRPGSRLRMHLEIRLQDGTEAISTFNDEPLELTLGDGTLVPGLEELLLGLEPGAEECFLAHGDDLYGERSAEKVHWMERDAFPDGLSPAPGQVIAFDTPGGQEIAGVALALDGKRVQMDFNHPLAGRSLQIRIAIIDVSEPDKGRENP